jgi:SAM-dependent methyltransferase
MGAPPSHEYSYSDANAGWAHGYLVQPLLDEIDRLKPARAFEIGAGSGYVASLLAERGIEITAIEPSESGVALARRHHPNVKMHAGSAYDDLAKNIRPISAGIEFGSGGAFDVSAALCKSRIRLARSGRHSDRLNAVSRLLEKSRTRNHGQDGRAFHCAVGWRTHQVLVDRNAHFAHGRGGFASRTRRSRWACTRAGEIDDPRFASTRSVNHKH